MASSQPFQTASSPNTSRPASAAVRGSAVNLLLALTRRRTTAEAGLEVFGDEAVWDTWLNGTPF